MAQNLISQLLAHKDLIFNCTLPMSQIRDLTHMIIWVSTNHIYQLFGGNLRTQSSIVIGFPMFRTCKIPVELQDIIFTVHNYTAI